MVTNIYTCLFQRHCPIVNKKHFVYFIIIGILSKVTCTVGKSLTGPLWFDNMPFILSYSALKKSERLQYSGCSFCTSQMTMNGSATMDLHWACVHIIKCFNSPIVSGSHSNFILHFLGWLVLFYSVTPKMDSVENRWMS